jgi:hypothetical protein
MTAPTNPAVELRGLTKRFGALLANAGVNPWAEPPRWRMPIATFET